MPTDRDMDLMLHSMGEQWPATHPGTTEPANAETSVYDLRHCVDRHGPRRGVTATIAGIALIAATVVLAVVLRPGVGGPATGSAATQFRLRLHLDTRQARDDGHPIRGYVQVINDTGKPIVIDDPCNVWLGVGLTNAHIRYQFVTDDIGCTAEGHLAVGTSTVKIAVATSYQQCQQATTQGGGPDDPACLPNRRSMIPPLPAGHYQLIVRTRSLGQQPSLPAPLTVTLTSS